MKINTVSLKLLSDFTTFTTLFMKKIITCIYFRSKQFSYLFHQNTFFVSGNNCSGFPNNETYAIR